MRWVYDVNVPPNDPPDANAVRYTEILVVLPAEVNLVPYNELRVSLKRLAGNSPDYETYMYAKFLTPRTDGSYTSIRVVNSVIGGQTATPIGVYYDWTINFDNLAGWENFWGPEKWAKIGAIIFGIRTQPVGPYGLGKGTIYVDDIRLVDRPGCTPLVGDLNGDCKVDFKDVKEFTDYWLMGK
jgi:hypothetical protein